MSIVWLTGNSGSGKTTLAKRFARENNWINLDGDEMRVSISLGAGFSKYDRHTHNLRVARLAKVLSVQNFDIIISVIAPYRSTRKKITEIIPDCKWIYIKKLQRYRLGRPYQPPKNVPIIDTGKYTENECYEKLRRAIYE